MSPKFYEVLEMAIEQGVSYGYERAFKYQDDPSPDHIKAVIAENVMTSIHEWFHMGDT